MFIHGNGVFINGLFIFILDNFKKQKKERKLKGDFRKEQQRKKASNTQRVDEC